MIAASSASFVALDLETTGLFPETDRIIEVGAVRFDRSGSDLGQFSRLIHPGRPVAPASRAIHGITDIDLAEASPAAVVVPEFLNWLRSPTTSTLLAHHASFDAAFLGREIIRLGLPLPGYLVIDTLALARRLLPEAPDHRLGTLAAYLGLDAHLPHRALSDAMRVKGLWLSLQDEIGGDCPPTSYPIFDPITTPAVPSGWDRLAAALSAGQMVYLQYTGGSRGLAPRPVTPRKFINQGGVAYLVAMCHLDHFEKSFRLDRVQAYEIADTSTNG